MNVQKIYEYALQREREGRSFFQSNAARMSHAAAQGIFLRLASEEERHIEFIEGLLRTLQPGEGQAVSLPDLEAGDRFGARARAEDLDQTIIESMVPDLTVLRTAYLIERDFAEFYESAAGKAEGEAKAALSALSRWERGHERLFKDLHDRVFQEYAEMPWGG